CKACLRSYHQKCSSLKRSPSAVDNRLCPECTDIMKAEEETNRSGCMQWLNGNVDDLSELLKYTIETVRAADKNCSFYEPVSTQLYPEYRNLIVNPMDLSQVDSNIKNKTYASTNSFLADIKWIFHNCIVFNSGVNNALISEVKNILRVAKQECEEIEICPDCYYNYYTMEEDNYFSAVCRRPHAIVWAKLKGHPYWPAKVIRYNEVRNEVDVRFFGTHDKCWLKPEKCFMISQNYPNNKKPTKFDQNKFDEAIRDMNRHVDQLEEKHAGKFSFHDKHVVFTVDQLYLNENPMATQRAVEFDSHDKLNGHKKVLNSYNGIAYKTLKVKTSKFDVRNHLKDCHDSAEEHKSPPIKRFKHNELNVSTKAQTNRCLSQSIGVRQELNSSIESDNSLFESRNDLKSDSHFDSNANNCKDLDENNRRFSFTHKDDIQSNHSSSSVLSKSKTYTVSGKSSEIINIDKSVAIESNSIEMDCNIGSNKSKTSLSSPSKDINLISNTFYRKLEEENNEINIKMSALEEENEDYKRTNEEFEKSIDEIKRKQCHTAVLLEYVLLYGRVSAQALEPTFKDMPSTTT
ncbi:unnamed protein product, partial [Medioppia subpectinata]